MEKILVICETKYEYDIIKTEFSDELAYNIVLAEEDLDKIIVPDRYSEVVVLIKDKEQAKEIIKKILAVNKENTIYNVYEECPEDDVSCLVGNFGFAFNWLKQIGYLREAKREVLDEIMKRGF